MTFKAIDGDLMATVKSLMFLMWRFISIDVS